MNGNWMAEKLVENIRRICREKGISIMQMESDLGFSAGLISRWNKTKTCPSFDKVVDIMKYLDVTYDELMEGEQPYNGRKREKTNSDKNDDKVIEKLVEGSAGGSIEWEKAGVDMPFEVETNVIFHNMLNYDVHRIYYAEYMEGWLLFSIQYNEETADILVDIYLLPAAGMDMVRLEAAKDRAMKLLKVIDEEIFNRMNQDKASRMKENLLGEDFGNRYRSVS